jgi:hypothetical protein
VSGCRSRAYWKLTAPAVTVLYQTAKTSPAQPLRHHPTWSPTTATPTLLEAERCFSSAATLASLSSFPSSSSPPSFYSHAPHSHPFRHPLHHQYRLNPSTLPLPPMGLPRVCDEQNAHTRRCSLDAMPSSPNLDLHLTMLLCTSHTTLHSFFFCLLELS